MPRFKTSKLLIYADRLDKIFSMYLEDINPFILRFESEKGEFPVEIQNEIRAMYNHLVRAAIADNEEQIITNLSKMESHSKRALIDCFKYTCMLCDDNYRDFMKRYEKVDLTYINQGEFLNSIRSLRKKAVDAMKTAKKAESLNTSTEDIFSLYQETYVLFEELNQKVDAAEIEANFLEKKAA